MRLEKQFYTQHLASLNEQLNEIPVWSGGKLKVIRGRASIHVVASEVTEEDIAGHPDPARSGFFHIRIIVGTTCIAFWCPEDCKIYSNTEETMRALRKVCEKYQAPLSAPYEPLDPMRTGLGAIRNADFPEPGKF